jgi:hypothetical protein
MTKPLTKTQQDELDAHKRHLEYKVHDAFSAIEAYLMEHHGECTDPACPHRIIDPRPDPHTMADGTRSPFAPEPQPRYYRHLSHTPISSEMVEAALMAGVRKFFDAGVIAPVVKL